MHLYPKHEYKYMENNNKPGETTPVPAAPAAEPTKVDTTPADSTDYKALLEKEKADKEKTSKQLNQAEFTIEQLKKAAKEREEAGLPPEVDLEEIRKSAIEAAQAETQKFLADSSSDTLEEELERITDLDKRELIKFHLENSIVRTGFSRGSISKDIAKAIAIADAPRREAEGKEIEIALSSKDSQGAPNSSGQDASKEQTKLSDVEEAQIKIIAAKSGKTVEFVRAKLIANKMR